MAQFDKKTISILRAVLDETANELNVTTATQAQMAQALVYKAAEGATRDELKLVAIKAGRKPAA